MPACSRPHTRAPEQRITVQTCRDSLRRQANMPRDLWRIQNLRTPSLKGAGVSLRDDSVIHQDNRFADEFMGLVNSRILQQDAISAELIAISVDGGLHVAANRPGEFRADCNDDIRMARYLGVLRCFEISVVGRWCLSPAADDVANLRLTRGERAPRTARAARSISYGEFLWKKLITIARVPSIPGLGNRPSITHGECRASVRKP